MEAGSDDNDGTPCRRRNPAHRGTRPAQPPNVPTRPLPRLDAGRRRRSHRVEVFGVLPQLLPPHPRDCGRGTHTRWASRSHPTPRPRTTKQDSPRPGHSRGESHMVKRLGRGRRRRNPRTQQPSSITMSRTGVGRSVELTTYGWVSPPSSWDAAAAMMAAQVRKSKRVQEKRGKARGKARRESVKEAKAEAWRSKYRKANSSPFSALPGMQGRVESGSRTPPVIPAEVRRQSGLASRGAASTLDPETATRILSLTAEGQTVSAISRETGIPRTTLSKWLSSGRAEKVAAVAVGEGLT